MPIQPAGQPTICQLDYPYMRLVAVLVLVFLAGYLTALL